MRRVRVWSCVVFAPMWTVNRKILRGRATAAVVAMQSVNET